MSKTAIFSLGLIGLLFFGSISPIWGAQLDARLSTHLTEAQPTFKFLKTVFIEYPEGGELSQLLKDKDVLVEIEVNKDTSGASDLIENMNSYLRSIDSTVFVSDLQLTYRAHLQGRDGQAAIDYKVTLVPTMTNYILRPSNGTNPALIDSHWRGLSVFGPVTITDPEKGEIDINTMTGFIKKELPEVYSNISGTAAETLLNDSLMDSSGILAQKLSNWHHLFDPSGTISETAKWGYTEKLVITSFTMGESSIREGIQTDKEKSVDFTTDKPYTVRTVESANSATIGIDGFVTETTVDNSEYFGSSPNAPKDAAITSTGGFPVGVMYGMAAAGGAVAIFVLVWSDKKLKKQRQQ